MPGIGCEIIQMVGAINEAQLAVSGLIIDVGWWAHVTSIYCFLWFCMCMKFSVIKIKPKGLLISILLSLDFL